jgi:hypothetical protein
MAWSKQDLEDLEAVLKAAGHIGCARCETRTPLSRETIELVLRMYRDGIENGRLRFVLQLGCLDQGWGAGRDEQGERTVLCPAHATAQELAEAEALQAAVVTLTGEANLESLFGKGNGSE